MTDELTYFKGTHRVIAPKQTIENNEDKLKTAGITRIADISDSDQPPKTGQSAFMVEKESPKNMQRLPP